jgi:hypothetical protein
MNGYVCFYKGKRVEVYADSSYVAQQKAATMLKAKRAYEVTVVLAEKNGEAVVHSTGGI